MNSQNFSVTTWGECLSMFDVKKSVASESRESAETFLPCIHGRQSGAQKRVLVRVRVQDLGHTRTCVVV